MDYLLKNDFSINVGFSVTSQEIYLAITETNSFLESLPENLFKSIDFKTTGSIIGAILCTKVAQNIHGAAVNPIEKGHPDIIPDTGLSSTEELLRNYPQGIEVKGTVGNISKGANLRAGGRRISQLTGITWQAHHREVNHLMGFLWDFNAGHNDFLFPMIIGVFYSDQLCEDDWGAISGTTGRNTKVSGMVRSGKEKMGAGWIALINQPEYLAKFKDYLYLNLHTE